MSFDLNISNYKKGELEELFNVIPNKYNKELLDLREKSLHDNISANNTISLMVKAKTKDFLSIAKNKLLADLGLALGSGPGSESSDDIVVYPNTNIVGRANGSTSFNLSKAFHSDYNLSSSKIVTETDHYIIEKPATSFGSSQPSEFFPGVINPLKKRIINQVLNVDTRFRNNYQMSSSTNFHFDLPLKLSNIMRMQLSAFEFPTTVYNISRALGNNYFKITINETANLADVADADCITPCEILDDCEIKKASVFENMNNLSIHNLKAKTSMMFVIPDGEYNATSLIDYLNEYVDKIEESSPFHSLLFVLNNANLASSINQSGRMCVATKRPGTFTFNLDFQVDLFGNPDNNVTLPLKFGWLVGFRQGVYINNDVYMSEGFLDLSGARYMYLVVDDYNNNVNNNFYGAFTTSILNKNILARISFQSVVATSFNTVSQNNLSLITNPRDYFGPVDIQKLQIQLLDEYGRVVDLNYMDFSFCLSFQCVYDL